MARKDYRHIKLPRELISREGTYTPPTRRDMRRSVPPSNVERHKTKLRRSIRKINNFSASREEALFFRNDKGSNEVKIKFFGPEKKEFISRYRINVYKKSIDRRKNEVVYGFIGNRKIGSQDSDFERLQKEFNNYIETNELRSYFLRVKEIEPLTIKEIVERELLEKMISNPEVVQLIDISFSGQKEFIQQKIDRIKIDYREDFVSEVNSDLLHFCRIRAKYSAVEKIVQHFRGVVDIEQSPVYTLEASSIEENLKELSILPHESNISTILVFDSNINTDHILLDGVVERVNGVVGPSRHATAVASLAIYGAHIKPSGSCKPDNKVISVNVMNAQGQIVNLEETIKKIIEEYAPQFPLLLANLSINRTNNFYKRKKGIDKLTILLDELSAKYNCLFTVSTGNLFDDSWTPEMFNQCERVGYPGHFKLHYTRILPPADSINNVTVGLITYQKSVNSIIDILHPTLHTRGNIDSYPFIKPDLVHFDSNYDGFLSSEDNGLFMAHENSHKLTKIPGTSFAAPLVAHDAGLLHSLYPQFNNNSIKALLIHFSKNIDATDIGDNDIKQRTVGFGMPDVNRAKYSTNSASTMIIEDTIQVGKEKDVKIPIPSCISGDRLKRLRIRETIVYNPTVNPTNPLLYNPIHVFAKVIRDDEKEMDGLYSRDVYGGAHQKSNVKRYKPIEKSTREHMGCFWTIKVICENKDSKYIPESYRQKYSMIVSLEDIKESDNIDLHEEVHNMIDIETHIDVPIEIQN